MSQQLFMLSSGQSAEVSDTTTAGTSAAAGPKK